VRYNGDLARGSAPGRLRCVQGGARLARDDAEHERLGRADVQMVQAHGAEQAVRAREACVGLLARAWLGQRLRPASCMQACVGQVMMMIKLC